MLLLLLLLPAAAIRVVVSTASCAAAASAAAADSDAAVVVGGRGIRSTGTVMDVGSDVYEFIGPGGVLVCLQMESTRSLNGSLGIAYHYPLLSRRFSF